jgi:hypothetical protein
MMRRPLLVFLQSQTRVGVPAFADFWRHLQEFVFRAVAIRQKTAEQRCAV